MAKMCMLSLQVMRERIGDDRQRMSQEMMELYKKESEPTGWLSTSILQMPIFISLYWALMSRLSYVTLHSSVGFMTFQRRILTTSYRY